MNTGRQISICFVGLFILLGSVCYLIATCTAGNLGAVNLSTLFAIVLGLITLIGGLIGAHLNSAYETDGNPFLYLWMGICFLNVGAQLWLQWGEGDIQWGLFITLSGIFEVLYILTLLFTTVMLACGRNRNGYESTTMMQEDTGNKTDDDEDPTAYELQEQGKRATSETLMKERHPGLVKRPQHRE